MRPTLLCCAASLLLLSTLPLLAQEEPEFPDSLLFGAPVDVRHVLNLDSAGLVTAELPEVPAKLMELEDRWYGGKYALAVASAGGYDLFPVAGDWVNDIQVSTADVRSNHHLQVVVRTMSQAGHTGWEHSIHEREWGVQLWDLQERRPLLSMANGHSHEEWTNTWVPDSTGELPYEERTMLSSEGDISCELTEVSFGTGTMTLVRTDDCPDLEDKEAIPLNERKTIRYVLSTGAWVKQ